MKKKTFWILMSVFLLIFGISTFFVLREVCGRKHTRQLYTDLAEQVSIQPVNIEKPPAEETAPAEVPEITEASELRTESSESFPAQTWEEPEENILPEPSSPEPEFLPEYAAVSSRNPDMIGWLYIEDTSINLPVMYTPDRPDFYLRRDFTGEQNRYGCLYLQEECDPEKPSDNLIIHGHNMWQDGLMFGQLQFFLEESFWEDHRTFRFDTLKERQTYEIISVARTAVDEFHYYDFIDAASEENFRSYVDTCKRISLYDTGVDAVYGDQLLTLSTCFYHKEGGRLIVVAKKVE